MAPSWLNGGGPRRQGKIPNPAPSWSKYNSKKLDFIAIIFVVLFFEPIRYESIFFVPNTLAQEYSDFVVSVQVVSFERMNDNIIIV